MLLHELKLLLASDFLGDRGGACIHEQCSLASTSCAWSFTSTDLNSNVVTFRSNQVKLLSNEVKFPISRGKVSHKSR